MRTETGGGQGSRGTRALECHDRLELLQQRPYRPAESGRFAIDCFDQPQAVGRVPEPNAGERPGDLVPLQVADEMPVNRWVGEGRSELTATDIRTALKLYRTACGLQIAVLVLIGVAIGLVIIYYWDDIHRALS